MTKDFCDRCGKELQEKYHFRIEAHYAPHVEAWLICLSCFDVILEAKLGINPK